MTIIQSSGGFKILLSIVALMICLTSIAQPQRLEAERLAYLEEPIAVMSLSTDEDDDRLLIPCHNGQVWIMEDGEIQVPPFLDIGEGGIDILNFTPNAEQGLNGLVLDPNFDENGYYYVTYNGTDPDGFGEPLEQRMVCFQRDEENPNVTDYDTWYEVLVFDEGDEPEYGHNGGQMCFDTNGHMFVSCGDGGATGTGIPGGASGGDDHGEFGNGQNLQTLLGKILRIDVHGMNPYTIPEDNPFVDDPEVLDEIWSYGWRNPWKFSLDTETGDMFIGDVGEVDWEEINVEPHDSPGGLNYGWRLMEGTDCYEPLEDCDTGNLVYPVFQYNHFSGWCAVIAGFMYRGEAIPTLYGHFILADFCGFQEVDFWLMHQGDLGWETTPVDLEIPGGLLQFGENRFGFGQDKDGELYLCTQIAVYKILRDLDVPIAVEKPDELDIYPNPTNGSFTINAGIGNSIDRIEMWDASGRKITDELLTGVSGSVALGTGSYSPGVYTLKVYCNGSDESRTTRLIISSKESE